MTLIELFPLTVAVIIKNFIFLSSKAGNIIFNEMIWPGRDISQKIPDIICLIMAGLPFLLPSKYINGFICPMPEDVYTELGYDSVKNEFLFVKSNLFKTLNHIKPIRITTNATQ